MRGNAFIVHIEIQNQNQATMPDRMLRYLTDIRLNYPNQNVYQYLLYIGKQPLAMASGISSEQLQYHYNMLDMHEMDYQFFMQQNSADALVLAVLCNFKETEPRAVVHEILTRLMAIPRTAYRVRWGEVRTPTFSNIRYSSTTHCYPIMFGFIAYN